MAQVKKRSIALALCCLLVASPVWAKTFVGVLYPLFGPMAAIGLVQLADELKTIPDVEVATYLHQSWKALVDDINRQPKGTRILIVGYSLGANNAVLVANNTSYVDSIIALQPSMLTSQESLTGKVGKVIEIYNPNPWMTFGGMGSQKLGAPNIQYIVNNDTHPGGAVQRAISQCRKKRAGQAFRARQFANGTGEGIQTISIVQTVAAEGREVDRLGIRYDGPAQTRAVKTRATQTCADES